MNASTAGDEGPKVAFLAPAANVNQDGVPPGMRSAIKAHESGGGLGFRPDEDLRHVYRKFPATAGNCTD